MTDMETKAFDLAFLVHNEKKMLRRNQLTLKALTEAHCKGQQNPDEETRARLYTEKLSGFENWRKYKQDVFDKGVEEGFEKAEQIAYNHQHDGDPCNCKVNIGISIQESIK